MLTNVHCPPANRCYKISIVQVCVTHMGYADKFDCMRNTPSADGHGNIQRINFSTPGTLLFQWFHPSHLLWFKIIILTF